MKQRDGHKSERLEENLPRARREEILDMATALFAQHGYSDTITQELAEKLQVGKGTLYRYFPSKRELFLAAVDRVMRRLRERVDAGLAGIEAPLERIAQAIRGHLAFFAEHPEYVELLIQERAQFKDREKPTYFEHRDCNVERWRSVVSWADRRGPSARRARRTDHRRPQRPGLRHHVHELFHRPAETVRRPSTGSPRYRLLRYPERVGAGGPGSG